MISDAGLNRMSRAAPMSSRQEFVSVRADDVFSAVRTIRELRRVQERHEELKAALALVGSYLREEPEL